MPLAEPTSIRPNSICFSLYSSFFSLLLSRFLALYLSISLIRKFSTTSFCLKVDLQNCLPSIEASRHRIQLSLFAPMTAPELSCLFLSCLILSCSVVSCFCRAFVIQPPTEIQEPQARWRDKRKSGRSSDENREEIAEKKEQSRSEIASHDETWPWPRPKPGEPSEVIAKLGKLDPNPNPNPNSNLDPNPHPHPHQHLHLLLLFDGPTLTFATCFCL